MSKAKKNFTTAAWWLLIMPLLALLLVFELIKFILKTPLFLLKKVFEFCGYLLSGLYKSVSYLSLRLLGPPLFFLTRSSRFDTKLQYLLDHIGNPDKVSAQDLLDYLCHPTDKTAFSYYKGEAKYKVLSTIIGKLWACQRVDTLVRLLATQIDSSNSQISFASVDNANKELPQGIKYLVPLKMRTVVLAVLFYSRSKHCSEELYKNSTYDYPGPDKFLGNAVNAAMILEFIGKEALLSWGSCPVNPRVYYHDPRQAYYYDFIPVSAFESFRSFCLEIPFRYTPIAYIYGRRESILGKHYNSNSRFGRFLDILFIPEQGQRNEWLEADHDDGRQMLTLYTLAAMTDDVQLLKLYREVGLEELYMGMSYNGTFDFNLLDRKPHQFSQDYAETRQTPIMWAGLFGSHRALDYLISKGAHLRLQRDSLGRGVEDFVPMSFRGRQAFCSFSSLETVNKEQQTDLTFDDNLSGPSEPRQARVEPLEQQETFEAELEKPKDVGGHEDKTNKNHEEGIGSSFIHISSAIGSSPIDNSILPPRERAQSSPPGSDGVDFLEIKAIKHQQTQDSPGRLQSPSKGAEEIAGASAGQYSVVKLPQCAGPLSSDLDVSTPLEPVLLSSSPESECDDIGSQTPPVSGKRGKKQNKKKRK